MFSDREIREAIKHGALSIEPFDETSLGPCSYDLTIERIWRVANLRSDRHDYSLERFIDACCEPYDGVLLPYARYIGVTREKVTSSVPYEASTRSSIARNGIKTMRIPKDRQNQSDRVFFTINTFGTTCEIPEGVKFSQVFFVSGPPASKEALKMLIFSGQIDSSSNLELMPEGEAGPGFMRYQIVPHSILLHIGNRLRHYTGRPLRYNQNNDACFEEVGACETSYLMPGHFYLAATEERIGMPKSHAGILRRLPQDFGWGEIDPNSALVSPGSNINNVLEMSFPQGRRIRSGDPICRLDVYPLTSETENPYSGRYQNHDGPETSRYL